MANAAEGAIVARLAARHGLSRGAVEAVLEALKRGHGTMAQLSHPEFGGMAQWSPGMTMVGDMFNDKMKATFDAVATELAAHVRGEGGGRAEKARERPAAPSGSSSSSRQWWPSEFGSPSSSGSQNGARYAVFPEKRRLVTDDGEGKASIYDTGDHRIGGVSQQQSTGRSLAFTSQHGTVDLGSLKRVE